MGISQGPNSNLDSHLKIAIFHLCKAKKKYALATDDQKIIKRHILAKNLSSLTLDLRKHTIIQVYFLPATTTIGASRKDVKNFSDKVIKGQLISKQDCPAITSPKKQT